MLIWIRTAADIAGLGWSAWAVVALLRLAGRAVIALSVVVVAAAMLVGTAIALSLVHALTVAGILGATAALATASTVAWVTGGRPRPAFPLPGRRELAAAARGEPVVAALVAVAVLALLFEAFLAVAVAPNEQDALLYHLPRAAFWVQYHTALQFNAGTLGDPEVGNPPNAEIIIAWTMALSRGDHLANLVQWAFAWAFALSIYLGARVAGLRRPASLFAAALAVILPEPIMQASTSQNDLVAAALITSGAVMVVSGIRTRSRGELAVGALALGLAVGTKGTVVYALPGLALLGVGALVKWRLPRRLIAGFLAMLAVSVAALGAFNYVQNVSNTGDLTGGMDQEVATDYVQANPLLDIGRASFNLLDLPGLGTPRWLGAASRFVADPLFGTHLHGSYYGTPTTIQTDVSEDESAYGPVGWLVLAPLVLGCAVLRRVRWPLRLCALASCAYLAFLAVQLGYGPEEARLMMPAVGFAAPLLGLLAGRRWLAGGVGLLAVLAMVATIAYDPNKSLLRPDTPGILGQDRLHQQLVDTGFALELPALQRLDRILPGRARLGFLQQDDTVEYTLFGPHFEHYLVPLGDTEVTLSMVHRHHLRAIFIWNEGEWRRCGDCARGAGLRPIRLGSNALLLVPGAGG